MTTTTSSIFGTFETIEMVTTDKYSAVKLMYKNLKGESKHTLIFDKVFTEHPELGGVIDTLKAGDPIEMSGPKNAAGYTVVQAIKKIDKLPEAKPFTFGGKGGFKDNTVGQIKGNVVTNAVNLAIARAETDVEGMVRAALDVLQVHKQLEAMDIATIVGLKSATKASTVLSGMPKSLLPDTLQSAPIDLSTTLGKLTNKANLL